MASENPTKTNLSWYPRYPGDFMRDTGHLSLAEDGAYNRLLDHYYSARRGLPESIDGLIRICRAFTPDEQEAVRNVADQFFPLDEDGLRRNKRADVEIAKQAQKSEAARRSIEARWNKERNTDVIRTNNEGTYERNTIHNHNHNQIPEPESQPKGGEATPCPPPKKRTFKDWSESEFKAECEAVAKANPVLNSEDQSAFFQYWTEPTPTGRLKLSTEKTWDTLRRMNTWRRNGESFKGNTYSRPAGTPVNHIKNPRERMMAQ